MAEWQPNSDLLTQLFRQEYLRMIAVLCRHFGLEHIETAEDIVSETFLKASEHWAHNGVPENPPAWLYTVAKNKAKDHLKRHALFEQKIAKDLQPVDIEAEKPFEYSSQFITDSQLAMIFAVCDPGNSNESQICLALQILCGFSVEEIANAFLTKIETIKKRLLRGRTHLRNCNFQITSLSKTAIKLRLDTVLQTLYLLFNEGYFSRTNDQVIRKELCSEAIRLALVLTENVLTNTSQTNALLALMCFQSSRLEARINDKGEAVLFNEQDKSLWDNTLIEKGNYYLVNACDGSEVSKYHLEAGIAYWHTTGTTENKWQQILQLYNQLILIEYSPVAALNRAFAFANVYGRQKAIEETEKLQLTDNSYYHNILGYLYESMDLNNAIGHYKQAIALTKSKAGKQTMQKEIDRLKKKRS
ncbi:sigma-70 family RNA polymerase sigma factor [Chitinophaga agrisoli]|uniref:Sigma-70 family RNA polymerase sigma factor n=1 Tax=Chitinophaga agrisoli TaxID=2607653 RepID=A0A5B2VQ48_9BACT|nr:sigma-70 family RNA polymerase sigma factor [Chitinophaga agrisoli]KAA2240347.1 sigma-70 family RNA polymerase sigma factor [Chitinophaga agrisoli]